MPGIVFVALGGALGSSARYLVGLAATRWLPGHLWPWATLAVNVLGCLAIGWILGAFRPHAPSETLRLFLLTGVLGGFTTFSSFGAETFTLAQSGHAGMAAAYAASSLVAGIAAVWLGFSVHR
jgi:CrcB protein